MQVPFEGFVDPASLKKIAINVTSGVCFLFKGDDLVYIGSSVNAFGRIRLHLFRDKNHRSFPLKDFDTFSFIPHAGKDLRQVERAYIRHFRPKYNCAHNPNVAPRQKGMKYRTEKTRKALNDKKLKSRK